MESFLLFLTWLGFLLYGGPLLAFALLLPLAERVKGLAPWHVDRLWRAWGPGSGLGLGLAFFAGVLLHRVRTGGFTWGWSTASERWVLASHVAFLLLWVSYTVLEVWRTEALRRFDDRSGPLDEDAYRAARRPVVRHVAVNALLLLGVLALAALA
ncbi:MAG: hypothetical protein JXB39_14590 [Deltaproteobacteria bacterium]|nr:hypothetical protein [Deltaproteobacteria bacterium]